MTAREQLSQAEDWLADLESMLDEAKTTEGAEDVADILRDTIETTRTFIMALEPYAEKEEAEELAAMNREYESAVL